MGTPTDVEDLYLLTVGLDVYPQALTLPPGETRQMVVRRGAGDPISSVSAGTRYVAGNTDVLSIDDLREGMVLKGTVRNVVDFGAFVDIGVKQDGLVHVSKMAKQYVRNPHEFVGVGDVVDVTVVSIDRERGRVGLSMVG